MLKVEIKEKFDNTRQETEFPII